MRWFHWLLIVAGVLGVLAMIVIGPGSIWINSFVHSDAFRHDVEARASAAAGGTVEIKDIDFSIWSGVTLSGVATKLQTPQGTVVAQIEGVKCSYSLFALLSRKLELEGVTVTKPQIVLTQEPASTVPTPAPPSVPAKTEPTAAQASSGNTSTFQLVLESAKVSDGQLSIKDATGATKADLQGIQVSAKTAGYYDGHDVTGTLRIATIALPQNLSLTDFYTPITYHTGAVQANPFEATAFGGKLTGDYKLDPGTPSLLEVNATGLDVAQIGKTANPGAASKLSGSLALQSKWHGAETGKLTGEGDAQITDGKLEGVAVLRDLATIFQVRDLSAPVLKSVTTHFQVAEGTTRFSDLHISSTVFDMTGSGTISADGRLDANMVLTLHGEAMGGVTGAASSLIAKLPGGGGSIPFHISGTVESPSTNLSPNLFNPVPKVQKTIDKISKLFH